MQKLAMTAFVATNLVFVIAAAAQARPVRNYQDIERAAPPREFRSEADRTQRPSRRPPPSVPEHTGPDFEVQGAP